MQAKKYLYLFIYVILQVENNEIKILLLHKRNNLSNMNLETNQTYKAQLLAPVFANFSGIFITQNILINSEFKIALLN